MCVSNHFTNLYTLGRLFYVEVATDQPNTVLAGDRITVALALRVILQRLTEFRVSEVLGGHERRAPGSVEPGERADRDIVIVLKALKLPTSGFAPLVDKGSQVEFR